ncbi:MAG: polysaccharide biosynthesis tyrosine autokinase [Hyphomonadaceae bacterium]|nr:polysaccharide biosynthesis tyrosine autokinase [Hyphomonadaceae bacterium]
MAADFGGRKPQGMNGAMSGQGLPAIPSAADGFGFIRIVEMFRRRIWLFAAILASVFLIVLFATVTATRMYSSTVQVQIDLREKRVLGNVEGIVAGGPPDAATIDTETQIMTSRFLAGRVVDSLRLLEDREFSKPPSPGLFASVRAMFGGPPATVRENASSRQRRREDAITAVLRQLDVKRLGLTYLVEITFTSRDPLKSTRIADAYANHYLTQQLQTKYDTLKTANDWLSTRLSELSEEVQRKERGVEEYRAREGLLNADGVRLTEQTAQALNLQRAERMQEYSRAEARAASLRASLSSGGTGDAARETLQSPTISNLRTQQAELSRRRAELSAQKGPRHPAMLEIDRQYQSLEEQIRLEVRRIISSVEDEARIARQAVAAIDETLGAQQATLAEQNIGEVTLRERTRDADASRQLYEALLTRYREIAAQSGIEQPDARVVSRASIPTKPSSPKPALNMIIGLILGVALGALAVLIVELLEQSFRTPEDVQNRLNLTCLGQVPFLDRRTRTVDGELLTPESFVLKRPLSAFGEALRSVRAGAFFSSPDRKVKVLAITSALPDEGKTTTSIALARISALAGSKTVLVDCDLRRRSATHCIGLEVEKGLTEVLFRTATLNDVIQKDPGSGVDIVPLAQAEFTPRDLFGSDAMRSLIEALRARYDVIILDSAPVLPVSDTRVLASVADSVLMVVRWGKTPAPVVRNAIDQLRAHGASIAGVVLSGVESGLVSRLLYDKPDYYSELYQTYYIR